MAGEDRGGRLAIVIAAGLLAALAVVLGLRDDAVEPTRPQARPAATSEACARVRAQLAEYGEVRTYGDGETRVGVLGDSYATGDGLGDDRGTLVWTARLADLLGARVTADAVGHTGFVDEGVCGRQRYGERLGSMTGQPTVVVQGGLNDIRRPAAKIRDRAEALARYLTDDRVLIVGPVDAPAVAGEARVDEALRQAAFATGASYLSMLDLEGPFLTEGIHLTPAGHLGFARRVAAALEGS